tara:strand:+ start:2178 stop:2819 length:642 start_codon:yes stop_codon:yes gene_type:complete
MNSWEYENQFYLTSDKKRILKLLDHYEIFKKILKIKGDIIECGVFKGASLIRFLTFRDLIEKKINKRKIIGFDAFGKFPYQKNNKAGINFAKKHDANIGIGININSLKKILKKKKIKNYKLVKGDVLKTLPTYLKNNKRLKISLLHLDLDLYEPTKFVLNSLYKYISKNGIILIDDYSHIKATTLAIDEFLKNKKLKIHRVSKNGRPYFIQKK